MSDTLLFLSCLWKPISFVFHLIYSFINLNQFLNRIDLLKKQVFVPFVALKWRTNGARALFAGLACDAEPVY